CTLLAMPSAKGLFHKAIVQSGPGVRCGTMEKGTQNAQGVLNSLGLGKNDLEKLHELSPERLIQAARFYTEGGERKSLIWRPVVDGEVVACHPFAPEASPLCNDVPLLIGFNRDEGVGQTIAFNWFGRLSE